MGNINIAVRIFDNQQREFLECNIRTAMRALLGQWNFSSAADADVIIVSPNDTGTDRLITLFLNNKNKIPVVYSDSNNTISPWFLKRAASNIEITQLLNNIYKVLDISKNHTEVKVNNDVEKKHIVNDSKIQLFENAKTQMKLKCDDNVELYYDNHNGTFYGKNIHYESIFEKILTCETFPVVGKIADHDLVELFSINEVKWNFFKVMKMEGKYPENKNVCLTHWPDFSRLMHDPVDITLAGFFSRYSATVIMASNRLNMPIKTVTDFCSVAEYAGLFKEGYKNSSGIIKTNDEKSIVGKAMRSIKMRLYGDIR